MTETLFITISKLLTISVINKYWLTIIIIIVNLIIFHLSIYFYLIPNEETNSYNKVIYQNIINYVNKGDTRDANRL